MKANDNRLILDQVEAGVKSKNSTVEAGQTVKPGKIPICNLLPIRPLFFRHRPQRGQAAKDAGVRRLGISLDGPDAKIGHRVDIATSDRRIDLDAKPQLMRVVEHLKRAVFFLVPCAESPPMS